MSLLDLTFSDLYVAHTATTSWFKPTPDSLTVTPVPHSCTAELAALRAALEACSAKVRRQSFRIEWPVDGGPQLRVSEVRVASGRSVFVCRRFRLPAGRLAELGVPPAFARHLLSSDLDEGLVVFMGKAGSGKTTTAASLVKERLTHFGGVCWTVENPIEIPLEGQQGRGWCYQTEAPSDAHIGGSIRDMLRASPNIIFIGELRDSQAVREAITASTSGHLVVTTFHAGDLVSGLSRLSVLANNEKVSAALADALRAAVHLTLRNEDPAAGEASKGTGTPPRVLSVEPIWLTGDNAAGLQSIVREGNFHMLKSEKERQKRSAMTQRPLP